MADYDISQAFKEIENELIDSMMRNFSRHRAEENKEGYLWSQWQAEQLKSLEQYRKRNSKKFNKKFSEINCKVEEMLRTARADGNAEQEAEILQAIKDGFKTPEKPSKTSTAEFFKINDRKLDALIKATTNDLKKAETAILRMSNDKYRKAIFNAQVYANSGAGTYEKAVDMACRDMLRAGLNCVEYKNGARHTLADYADMAIRTANKRAYLMGEGEKRAEWGISTVVVNQRQGGCPDCAQYIGQVFIDDVYSNSKKSDGDYPLLSTAIAGGLFHPRCKDSTSTYYEGITTLKKVSKSELSEMKENEVLEQQKNHAENQAEKCGRIAKYSLDSNNKRIYQNRAEVWQGKVDEISEKLDKSAAKSAECEFISDDWKGLKYPQRKKRSDFTTDNEWQAFRKSYIEDFNKYNDDVDRIIKNHNSKVENITEKKFIKWAEERGIENVNIKGMSKTAMADFMSSYDSMIEKLPKAAGKLKSVDIVSTKENFSINQKALAWSDNDTSIHFAKSHFSKDKYSDVLQQEILSCVTGLNPDGANPYLHTYQHEMGHLIEKWVGKEAGGVDKLKEEIFKIFEGNLPDISDYGNNHGYGEWFAEMTSSYLNGTKSEKVEKFGGVLKKYFGSPDIAKSAESGIIKSLDVDDYEVVTYGKKIADDVNNTIIETMKQCENNGNFIISEISAKSIPATADGTPVLQIEPLSNGLLQLNLNTDVLSGRSLAEIDKMFETTDNIAANSLAEAIIHESGHAISISGKTVSDIEKLYEELSAIHIDGISVLARKDGAECLAELEVLRSRGAKVSDEAMRFYEEYMRRKY